MTKRYDNAIANVEEELKPAEAEYFFYKAMSSISKTLDTMYQRITGDSDIFFRDIEDFKPKGTFKDLLRSDVRVPKNIVSLSAVPDFLTHELGEHFPNDSELLDAIVHGAHSSVVGFYGTSGAGKTRTIFEIFVRSYGLYFVAADARTLNPGSSDFSVIYEGLGLFFDKSNPKENSKILSVYTNALIFCRLLVFCVLRHVFGKKLTCELWLRVQLTPKYYFGYDVFEILLMLAKSLNCVKDRFSVKTA